MSLKAFHIVFIALSTLLTWVFATWCVWSHVQATSPGLLVAGFISFAAGVGLIVYERWFIRKMKGSKFL